MACNLIICTNFGKNFASGRAVEIGRDEEAQIYSLTDGQVITNPDMVREGGLYVGLLPWETQIFFIKKRDIRFMKGRPLSIVPNFFRFLEKKINLAIDNKNYDINGKLNLSHYGKF
jgi:hypothetical protein